MPKARGANRPHIEKSIRFGALGSCRIVLGRSFALSTTERKAIPLSRASVVSIIPARENRGLTQGKDVSFNIALIFNIGLRYGYALSFFGADRRILPLCYFCSDHDREASISARGGDEHCKDKTKPPSGLCSPDGFATLDPDAGKLSDGMSLSTPRDAVTKLTRYAGAAG